jgi:hypothetical protein
MPLQATSGAASYDAFGGGVPFVPTYIEDVMSVWLYTGNGSTQTITNGIDLAGKGGLVWLKKRNAAATHRLVDTVKGVNSVLFTDSNDGAQGAGFTGVSAFTASGFDLNSNSNTNGASDTFASWTFREQAKFFDVVTWTGNGANRTIAHNLGSVPGCIIVKRTDATADWQVYHRSLANTQYLVLNSTAAAATGATRWNSTTPTSTVFSLGTDATVNASGGTYVAYVYAHNAGGFGLTGTDNVISCGSFTVSSGTGSTDVNLGYEPQWLLAKPSTDPGFATNWQIYDTMRGWVNTTNAGNVNLRLNPNLSQGETADKTFQPTATGFTMLNSEVYPSVPITYIYIAIRRGPMKVPTDATKVFSPVLWTGDAGASRVLSGIGFPPDFANLIRRPGNNPNSGFYDRLRGSPVLFTPSGQTESYWAATDTNMGAYGQASLTLPTNAAQWNASTVTYVGEFFRRAPSVFDVVCYTGTGANTTQAHNLGVAPELMIVKGRYFSTDWRVYSSALANTEYLSLNTTAAKDTSATNWNSTTPTSSVFSLGTATEVNYVGFTYVAYLFATCPGVSKVGSYTGNGTTQAIACGFTGGARFVLIKRTDATGGWYVYDTARGMTTLTDPYFLLNTAGADVATLGSVITSTGGFTVNAAILAAINTNAASYIFLAIA